MSPYRWIDALAAGAALLMMLTLAGGAALGQTPGKSESRRMPRMYQGAPREDRGK